MTQPFTTISGKFYVGMKLSDTNDKEKFKKIDSIRPDGVLQDDEIVAERKREAEERKKKIDDLEIDFGIFVTACAVMAPYTEGISAVVGLVGTVGTGIGDYFYSDKTKKEEAKTEQYKKDHNIK